MVAFRALFDYAKVLLETINWEITYVSGKYASSRLLIPEGKSSYFYAA